MMWCAKSRSRTLLSTVHTCWDALAPLPLEASHHLLLRALLLLLLQLHHPLHQHLHLHGTINQLEELRRERTGLRRASVELVFFTPNQREEPGTPLNRSDWRSEAGTNPLPFCILVLSTLLGMRKDSPLVCRLRGRGCVGCADGEWVMAAGRCNRRCGRALGSNRSPTQRSRAREPVPSGSRHGWVRPTTSETPLQDKPAPAGQTGGGEELLTFNW